MRNKTVFAAKTIKKRELYSIIIPAAGMGQRMKAFGPKCLIDINGEHLANRQISLCKKYIPRTEFFIVGGFMGEEVQAKVNANYVHNPNHEITNTAHSISLAIPHITSTNLIVVYGDLVFDSDILDRLPFNDNSTLCISDNMDDREVGCISVNNSIQSLSYGIGNKWAQITYFTGRELELLKQIAPQEKFAKSYFFEVINEIISAGGKFSTHTFGADQMIFDIDYSKDIKRIGDIK